MVPISPRYFELMNAARSALGFLSLDELAALSAKGIHILDPFSTLVSPDVEIAAGAVLWPGVSLEAISGGRVRIGAGTRLFPGAHLRADGGSILVGSDVALGDEGGFSVKAKPGETVEIGDRARLSGGGRLSESCALGAGSQVLGRIDVRSCRLGAGGDYTEADPDRRGAVLKGSGLARGLTLAQGQVIQAFGLFSQDEVRPQSFFHPPGVKPAGNELPWDGSFGSEPPGQKPV
jgi:carbonic anhydrase/acetyltransferase-like protein (isoleucine patch superfamily)